MRRSGLKQLRGRRVVVHTRDDQSLRGVLIDVFSDSIKLDAVEYLNEAQATLQPGFALVLVSNVSWINEKAD